MLRTLGLPSAKVRRKFREEPVSTPTKLILWINLAVSIRYVEVRDFVDETSERAYAALEYLRIVDIDDHVKFHLVAAGTKIAMLKFVFVPWSQSFSAFFYGEKIRTDTPSLPGGKRRGSVD